MRLVAWNCNMALHRKYDALLALNPDVAVISECAEPERLRRLSKSDWLGAEPVWIGRSETKGLAVLGFNGYRVELATARTPDLRYIAPVRVRGPLAFNLLAVWAQNAITGPARKRQRGPLPRALRRYRALLNDGPAVVAGDFNSNVIWDKPGWRNNHSAVVDALRALGLVSAYHAATGEAQGLETTPTLYWRDRTRDGPTYHIDYIFVPEVWRASIREVSVGAFDDWCGNGLSDHVPVVIDVRPHG